MLKCFIWTVGFTLAIASTLNAVEPAASGSVPSAASIRRAVERALPLLERASVGSADNRKCFTCHSQAFPIFASVAAKRHGFTANESNLQRQILHTHDHLRRGKQSYLQGKGQGGGVDTAGYALWALEDAEWPSDDVTSAVVDWLLRKQSEDGYWQHSSNRPPSEASEFTATYLALRALSAYGTEADQESIGAATAMAAAWLATAEGDDTEDQVFRLLSFDYADVPSGVIDSTVERLRHAQNSDGGWSQLSSMASDAYATATVLYALRRAGAVDDEDAVCIDAIRYLLDIQLDDGSWLVTSRSKPFQTYFETGFPHGKDQFISTTATGWAVLALLQSLPESPVPEIEPLAGTRPLDLPESDLSQRLMLTAHSFVEDQIEKATRRRVPAAGQKESAESRQQLRKILGVVEDRASPRMEHFGDTDNPAIVAETDAYQVYQVRWPVFGHVDGEGLFVKQRESPMAQVVAIPDADQTPEDLIGLITKAITADDSRSADGSSSIARRLADCRCDVVIPAIVSRSKLRTDDKRLQRADYTEREWIYRQAFHMGRHVIGYDIQRVLAAVDYFESRELDGPPIGVLGYGEGGLIALHAAAIDTRIDSTFVSGYFDRSDRVWREPIYRNVWSRLKRFGNAEIASLVAGRNLVIEHSAFPSVAGHKGDLSTPRFRSVKAEFEKIPDHSENSVLVAGDDGATVGPWSDRAVAQFIKGLTGGDPLKVGTEALVDRRASADQWVRERQERTTKQLETHVQSLVRGSEHVRDDAFLYEVMPEFNVTRWSTERVHPTVPSDRFAEAVKLYRERFHTDAMGRFDEELVSPNPRTRKIISNEKWTAYDVVLDVYDGLFSWGVLVVPSDLKSGERRPVVVCQHGRNGLPRTTIDAGKTGYSDFAARLAERGFIIFSPHNLYRGEDQYRWLDRKANVIGCTLFSFLIAQHDATFRWLDSLHFVDGDRIAFYGLSYGGESAVRIPTVVDKYCLSICAGDFNQWTRKVASTDQSFSFMNTIEWEMPYWNLGHTFDYAEMSYLMFPRPFMVERGHHDRVGRDRWVAHEFAKVRWLYAQFGFADRTEIEFFQGGHAINGEGTFRFLHRHLDWPLPKESQNSAASED